MDERKQEQAAAEFAKRWEGKGYEKGESQPFWLELLGDVLGIKEPTKWIEFEEKVKLDHTSFIDGYISKTHVLIEQKSLGKDLYAPAKQSDGSVLTPFQQAKRYAIELPYSRKPRWVVTCNFSDFLIYDMERPDSEPEHIALADFSKDFYRLYFLIDSDEINIQKEMEISLKAGELVGRLYDALLKQYIDPASAETLRSLNILCVRLVFCLYAESASVFPGHNMFHNYLASFNPQNVRSELIKLFRVLDTKEEERDPYMEENLKAFPYVNGGLFAEEHIEIPRFTEEIVQILLDNASRGFDWSGISPTIFGAVFESTLNPETRRSGGMHYTSIENIHKVIDPLFFEELKVELNAAKNDKALRRLQDKLASLTFLDPACGSGNFLTETFISLRRLENEIIKRLNRRQSVMGFDEGLSPIKVSISQFYGIEINDFAVTVARTALWIAEHQMLRETQRIIMHDLEFLPLKSYNNIREGDALTMDWCKIEVPEERIPEIYARHANIYIDESLTVSEPEAIYNNVNVHVGSFVAGKQKPPVTTIVTYDYIIGNPPFVGARMMSQVQKDSMIGVFGKKWKNIGNLDFVCAWYKKAVEIMRGTKTRAAFVSTNSICQGETVANLWQPLMTDYGVKFDFAYRTFRWDSESESLAHVHCVVIGFNAEDYAVMRKKIIFDGNSKIECEHINAYLIPNGADVFVGSRSRALCDVPEIGIGNKPIDGGNYLFTKEEMNEFVAREPNAKQYFHPWYGAVEFINRTPRYCLWLGDCTPAQLRSMPHCMARVKAVREYRLKSPSAGTVKLADRPTRFHVENMPDTEFLLVPRVSSENRRYIPIGFLSNENFVSDAVQIIPNASLYHFGILTSNVHMAWMRAVCGRLKSDYRYSKDVVYNNFPWPTPTEEQRAKIEQTAQAILDARNLYPDSSLADLYDVVAMPDELRRAHQANDRAVMQAYGFPIKGFTEQDCVAKLMEMYKSLIAKE